MILVTRSSMPDYDEYCAEIKSMWDTHWLTNMGEKHRQLEAMLKAYLGTPRIVLYTNGHLALEDALAAMRLPEGGEVITTPFTFASTTHAIVRKGLKPVFCDIRPDDFTLDPLCAREMLTPRTCALLPVHVYGNICDVEAIGRIAEERGLKVVYDAAHAFGVRRRGESAANFGDVSMFSFHATKVFNTIEGGALCFRDPALEEEFNDRKNFGIRNPEEVIFVGGNAKMNEFQAAMGICNLRRVDGEIAKRKLVDRRYREQLGGVSGIKIMGQAGAAGDKDGIGRPGCESARGQTDSGVGAVDRRGIYVPPVAEDDEQNRRNYAYFPVLFDGERDRDEVCERLKAHDIIARKYFWPLTSTFECYRGMGFDPAETPNAAYAAAHVLTLPIYADLALDDVDRICRIITT